MKSGITTSQAGHASTSQRTARRRTVIAVAAVIVGLAIAAFKWGALRPPSHEDAEPGREASRDPSPTEQSRAARPALPPALPAQPALPAEPAALPAEPAATHRRLPTAIARQVTENKVQKYIHEAYPAWRRAHPGQECPHELSELTEYMDDKDPTDGWGRTLRMSCGANRPPGAKKIKVTSLGRDAERGTEDDITAEE